MLKKAASGVLALLPCSRTMSTLRASKGLRPCWIDPSERLRACFFGHSLPLMLSVLSWAFIGLWSEIFNSPNLETAVGRKTAVYDIGVHREMQKVVVTSVLSFRPLRAICGSAEGEISPKGRNDKGGRGKSSLVVMRHFSVLRGALRVRHEITGTIGRPRFVIGARCDEGA